MAADVLWHLSYGQLISPPRFTSHVAGHTRDTFHARARERVCMIRDLAHDNVLLYVTMLGQGRGFLWKIYKITFPQATSFSFFIIFIFGCTNICDVNKGGFSAHLCVWTACVRSVKDKNFYAAWQNPVNKEKTDHIEHIQCNRLMRKITKLDLKNNFVFILKIVSQNGKT